MRNWIPAGDRGALDSAIRKARVAGVEIGVWPAPATDLDFFASTIDGSGAQSLFAVSRTGKKGLFAGVLLRLGVGVIDAWIDPDLSRAKINKMLKESQTAATTTRVDQTFVNTMIQHAIGTSVVQDGVPAVMLLELAETLGGVEWKDRLLDVAAEATSLFDALDPAERSAAAIETGLQRGLDLTAKEAMFASWFEDGPNVAKALAKLARTDQVGMIAAVMNDILPDNRAQWAERFMAMAMWCQASGDAKLRAKGRDLVLTAHALVGDEPIGAVPAMAGIALNTMRAMLLGGW